MYKITRRSFKQLFESWDGYDFYTKEFILNNFNLDSNDKCYPVVDHKISRFYGFKNNISPEEIGDISNLCITQRYINSRKHKDTDKEFLERGSKNEK